MRGARPLTPKEIKIVASNFAGRFAVRNRSLFMLGVNVGGRISEMLSLTVGDVWQNGLPVNDLLFRKEIVKGKDYSRMVPVNKDGRNAIAELVVWHETVYGDIDPNRPLFTSRKGNGSIAVSRGTAHKILESAFQSAGLNGKVATHSLRKSFAQRFYDVTGDIYAVKELLGHQSVETTQRYLGVSYSKLKKGCDQITIDQCNRSPLLYHSLAEIGTDSLIAELSRRGRDMSSMFKRPSKRRSSENRHHFDPIGAIISQPGWPLADRKRSG